MRFEPFIKVVLILSLLLSGDLAMGHSDPAGETHPEVKAADGKFYVYYNKTEGNYYFHPGPSVYFHYQKVFSKDGKLISKPQRREKYITTKYDMYKGLGLFDFGAYQTVKYKEKVYLFSNNDWVGSESPHYLIVKKIYKKIEVSEDGEELECYDVKEKDPKKYYFAPPKDYKASFIMVRGAVSDEFVAVLVEEERDEIKESDIKSQYHHSPLSVYLYEKGLDNVLPKRYFLGFPRGYPVSKRLFFTWREKFVAVWLSEIPQEKEKNVNNDEPAVNLMISLVDPEKSKAKNVILKDIHWNTDLSADIIDDTICIAYHQGMGCYCGTNSKIKTMFLNLTELFDK